ncbi:MAG: gas vesicle protein GvpG [Elusimicrobiota bacterium]
MFLIDDILLAPVKGVMWLGSKINDMAEQEATDEGKIKEELMELQMRFEIDEISEEEYNSRESEILVLLDEIRKRKESEK